MPRSRMNILKKTTAARNDDRSITLEAVAPMHTPSSTNAPNDTTGTHAAQGR